MKKKDIGNKIKGLRIQNFGEKRGSQGEMARELGIPYTTYRDCERGIIGIDTLIKLYKKFNIDLNWLLMGEKPEIFSLTEDEKILCKKVKAIPKNEKDRMFKFLNLILDFLLREYEQEDIEIKEKKGRA